jgi:hypothetical protein
MESRNEKKALHWEEWINLTFSPRQRDRATQVLKRCVLAR